MKFVGGVFSYEEAGPDDDGVWADWWLVEDLRWPLTRLSAAAGGYDFKLVGLQDVAGPNYQAVRATMGSIFAVPLARISKTELAGLATGLVPRTNADMKRPSMSAAKASMSSPASSRNVRASSVR